MRYVKKVLLFATIVMIRHNPCFAELGVDWHETYTSPILPEMWGHEMVVFKGGIWIVGSFGHGLYFSSDGRNWRKMPYYGISYMIRRSNHKVVVYDDKMWILGGKSSCYLLMMYGTRRTGCIGRRLHSMRHGHLAIAICLLCLRTRCGSWEATVLQSVTYGALRMDRPGHL